VVFVTFSEGLEAYLPDIEVLYASTTEALLTGLLNGLEIVFLVLVPALREDVALVPVLLLALLLGLKCSIYRYSDVTK
jgi:riboflavin transporter FmnP